MLINGRSLGIATGHGRQGAERWPPGPQVRAMIRSTLARRTAALALIGAGAALMLLAPPVWMGLVPLTLGLLLEVIGVSLEHDEGK